MKKIVVLLVLLTMWSCSSTKFVDSWKNDEIAVFEPQKLLVIGITDNLTAKKIFEEELKNAFLNRNLNTFESSEVFDVSFSESPKSQEEVDAMTEKLLENGFDAVVITAVKGVDDRRQYHSGYYNVGFHWRRFGRYYYRFQNIYYTPGYYDNYKVYHIETSIYNIKENVDENKSLVWVGSFDIVNPYDMTATIDDYIERIVVQLEREGLIQEMK